MHRPPRAPRTTIVGFVLLMTSIAACGGSSPTATPASAGASASAGSPAPTTAPVSPTGTPRPTPIPVATGTPLGDRLLATLTVDLSPCAMAADAKAV